MNKLNGSLTILGSILLAGCSSAEPTDGFGSEELGQSTQQLAPLLPAFPNTVLPMRFQNGNNCLKVQGGTMHPGSTLTTTQACSATDKSQDWFLIPLKDNSYQIRTGHSALALSIRSGSTASGAVGEIKDIFDSLAVSSESRWEVVATASGGHQLRNVKSQLCLSASGTQVSCASATSWMLSPKLDFPFSIAVRHSGMCLNVANGTSEDGANVQQYPCSGSSNERWYVQRDAANPTTFFIKAKHSNKCLDVADGSSNNNANVQQYQCTGAANQRWEMISFGNDGYFQIRNVSSQKCLDVAGAATNANANVQQYTCQDSGNQNWRWNYQIEAPLVRIIARDSAGGGIALTSAQWDLNFGTAQQAFLPWGVKVSMSSPTYDVRSPALHNLSSSTMDSGTFDCVRPTDGLSVGLMTPRACADHVALLFPGKIVAYVTKSAGGFVNNRLDHNKASWVQLIGQQIADVCANDSCATTGSDNRTHVAHELGHWFGLNHTNHNSGDDWLSDTDPDNGGDVCSGQGPNPPAIANNIMSYYYGCTPRFSYQQGGIVRATAYARFSNGVN